MGKGIFITGTGTDVGKTYVTALLVKALQEAGAKAAYYKAAASGNQRDGQGRLVPGDAVWVKEVSGIAQPLETMIPYVYEDAVSPHLAARKEGNPVEPFVVLQGYHRLRREYGYVTMEGSGGILCPLRWENGKGLWLGAAPALPCSSRRRTWDDKQHSADIGIPEPERDCSKGGYSEPLPSRQ